VLYNSGKVVCELSAPILGFYTIYKKKSFLVAFCLYPFLPPYFLRFLSALRHFFAMCSPPLFLPPNMMVCWSVSTSRYGDVNVVDAAVHDAADDAADNAGDNFSAKDSAVHEPDDAAVHAANDAADCAADNAADDVVAYNPADVAADDVVNDAPIHSADHAANDAAFHVVNDAVVHASDTAVDHAAADDAAR